ncbi:hypothetical protein WM29_11105 [Burkholderia ubonensis]|nr:hypothetical protein WM29_11105 [Burkholderia ubonensis]
MLGADVDGVVGEAGLVVEVGTVAGVVPDPVVEVGEPVLPAAVAEDWPPPPSPPQAASITGTSRERASGAMLRIGLFLVGFFGLRRKRDRTGGACAAARERRGASRCARSARFGIGSARQV